MSEEKELRDLSAGEILASEYNCVYAVDLVHDTFALYAGENVLEEDLTYSAAFCGYVRECVHPQDRFMMLEAGSVERVRSHLAERRIYVTSYRRPLATGGILPCEIKWIREDKGNDAPERALLCLSNRERNRDIAVRYVDEQLRTEYASIFIVDLEQDEYQFIYRTATSGFANVPGGRYSDTIREYAGRVHPNYRGAWLKMTDPAYMREYLCELDRREYAYILNGADRRWRRCVCQVLERKAGVVTSFIMTYMTIDEYSAEKYELDATIAEQKKALEKQQELLENALAHAEAASRAKSTFLFNMSHDIRTPMNAIIGFTQLALEHASNTERVQDYLEKIGVSSHHLLSLINDILDMSRIESGKLRLDDVDCSIPDIMRDISTIMLGQARAKHQNFALDSVGVTDENVICDKLRLHQVLINLLSNAVKFTPAGGSISVSVRQVASENGYGTYDFHVRDNGIGMSREFAERIFEPFERERTSTVSGTQGTGLGMSITKNIVDLMGGTIDVVSEQGVGTEFIVHVKLKLQDRQGEYLPIERFVGARALVVDDDFASCDSVSNLLSRLQIRSEWTMRGTEALLHAKRAAETGDPYSIYLVDWLMPDMNGIEVVRRIRRTVPDQAPIIVMTAYDWSDIEEEARAAGVTAFINKPLFLSSVYRALEHAAGIRSRTEEETAPDIDFNGKKLLLAEDNELNREIAVELLGEMGFLVDTAEDGTVAVEKMQDPAAAYDLILMDIQMPDMDGYEATRRIRAMGRTVPIVAMTANAFAEDRQAAFDAGMNEHVAKPIDPENLKDVLKAILL